jgi:malate dehydrogenase
MDIAVVGAAGSVGRAVCTQLLSTGTLGPGEKLQLVGRKGGKSESGVYGLRIDLLDAYSLHAPQIEVVLDGSQIDADVVIMVAGETASVDPSSPASRETVAKANLPIFEHYADMLDTYGAKDELVIVQSNPVELAVDVFADRLGRHRVVGAGSYNDTLRFRRELLAGLETTGRHPIVMGYMLGEHGTHSVPIWSSVQAGGLEPGLWDEHISAVNAQIEPHDIPAVTTEARTTLADLLSTHRAADAAAFVEKLPPDVRSLVKPWFAHWTGRTSTATAHSVVDLVAGLQEGHRVVLPLQVQLGTDDWPGIETVMGVLVDIDATGWHHVVPLDLTDTEHAALISAGKAIQAQIDQWRS